MRGIITNTDPDCETQPLQQYPSLVRFLSSRSVLRHLTLAPGLYLTDITFCREGNPSHRVSPKNPEKKLLNFNKYHKLARIVQGKSGYELL